MIINDRNMKGSLFHRCFIVVSLALNSIDKVTVTVYGCSHLLGQKKYSDKTTVFTWLLVEELGSIYIYMIFFFLYK